VKKVLEDGCVIRRIVSTTRRETGVNAVHLVTMATRGLALNLTASDACVLSAQLITSESLNAG